MVNSRLRLTLVGAFGFALVMYGVASLTGNWLGTPPWWKTWRDGGREALERSAAFEKYASEYDAAWDYFPEELPPASGFIDFSDPRPRDFSGQLIRERRYRLGAPPLLGPGDIVTPRRWTSSVCEGWEWVGWALAEVGLLVAVGAAFAGRRAPRPEPAV